MVAVKLGQLYLRRHQTPSFRGTSASNRKSSIECNSNIIQTTTVPIVSTHLLSRYVLEWIATSIFYIFKKYLQNVEDFTRATF